MDEQTRKLGVALVGLGSYSTHQLAPALRETKHCYLAGIVTGTPEKADLWKQEYLIPDQNIYHYRAFDQVKDNPDIDIVYVVLPNALHKEYVIRAAMAGKHVICEKPMAITVQDCDAMIEACRQAGTRLAMGYRLHFEPHNLEAMRLGRYRIFGKLRTLIAEKGINGTSHWRLDKKIAGGGPLMDLGIYCVQAVRYTTGMEPLSVCVKESTPTPQTIENSLTWEMELPEGIIATCRTSYSKSMNLLRAEAENGWFELSPAYAYNGIQGRTSQGNMNFPQVNQQALQLDDIALSIKENRPITVPGEMGRQDIKILEAIYASMRTGKPIEIN